jgi:hypothetical protein
MGSSVLGSDIPPIIAPFCIFWNKSDQGYIQVAEKVRDKNGKTSWKCPQPDGWELKGTFYAVSPMIAPLPSGMKMFYAKRSETSPYPTESVSLIYDPFDLGSMKGDGACFVTYNQPVPNTVPLYFHSRKGSILPSFDGTDGEEEDHISPVFVMTLSSLGLGNIEDVRFQCIDGRCLPIGTETHALFDVARGSWKLQDCVLLCDEITLTNGDPRSLFSEIRKRSQPRFLFKKFFQKMPPILIGIIVGLFMFLFMIVMIWVI